MMMTKNQKLFQKLLIFGVLSLFLVWSFEDLGHTRTEYVKYSDLKKPIKGDGSRGNPYQIAHPFHLKEMRDNLSSHFKLVRDLDLGQNKNFGPIGGEKNPFKGTFDGSGKMIKNLKIQRPDEYGVGFFGYAQEGSVIRNVRLQNIDIVGKQWVGGLLGVNLHKEITEAYFDAKAKSDAGKEEAWKEYGDIFEKRNRYGGKIEASYVAGKVVGEHNVGGLVGLNDGTIEASYAKGKINGNDVLGGLVGANIGTIKTSYATGKVEGEGNVGGLVGVNNGTVQTSYATGKVNGKENTVGGLVGGNGGRIKFSYATGKVVGKFVVGGLVGVNGGRIEFSYVTGDVEGKRDFIGGLVGWNHGTIKTSYATGEVLGERGVGGLVGRNDGMVEGSYVAGKVEGQERVGGLVGWNDQKGRIEGKNYWQKGSAKKGVGKNEGEASQIRKKSKSQIYALIRRAWKNEKMWVFAPRKHPRLRWQSSSR